MIERQLQGTINTIFTELIKEKGLEGRIQPYAPQEENRADITLKNKNGKTIFFIELKDPTARDGKSVFDSGVLMREVERAQRIEIKYFGNCNFLACAFFDKDKLYEKVSVNEGFFTLNDISRLSQSYSPSKEIIGKLRNIAEFYLERALEILDRKPIKFSELDELFIFKIRKLIEVYAYPISDKVWDKYRHNKSFERDITGYAQSQLWNKPTTFEEIENLTHIGVLMLISKLIFYKTYVDNKTWHELHPMKVPPGISTPQELEDLIWQYFERFQEVTGNFELLIGERSDIIFKIPFVSDAVIDLIKEILDTEGHYNFSNIPFDIIGRIFEELIREDERHKLGQYFTPPHIIDLINSFAIHKSNDKVFDPSCGSGTFLVRAYERKKLLCEEENKGVRHEIFLNEIYGNDLSGYPAYLSMLNLAIRNTRKPSYPRISNKDFFAITENSKLKFHDHLGEEENRILPKFDAIVGNPPYTRQEDIGTMHGTQNKPQIQKLVKKECGFKPSQRTSIYAYFFYHANIFLKDGGYLAFICQNSWLDTDYGVDLQKYLLRNYEIVAIMDSEVERFFPSASVNTTIVIVRKQKDEEERDNNIVKFVYFTTPVVDTIKSYKGVDRLHDILQLASDSVSNQFFKLNCVKQEILQQHNKWSPFLKAPQVYFDILEKGKNNLKDLAGKNGIAHIYYGMKTGCNEYFFGEDVTKSKAKLIIDTIVNNHENLKSVNEIIDKGLKIFRNGLSECWLIEEQFIKPVVKTTRALDKYVIDAIDKETVVLQVNMIDDFVEKNVFKLNKYRTYIKENYPYLHTYIKYGEHKEIKGTTVSHKPSCAGRPAWWDLGNQHPKDFILIQFRDKRNWTPIVSKDFVLGNVAFFGKFKKSHNKKLYALSLNSTFSILQTEMLGRVNLGDGLLTTYGPDLEVMQVVHSEKLSENLLLEINKIYDSLKDREAVSLFEELGTEDVKDVSLDKVNKYRLEIDNLILKVIGYSDTKIRNQVLIELYKAAIQTISSRIKKAQSLTSVKVQRNKVEFSVYVEQLKNMLVEGKYAAKNTITFAKQLEKLVHQISSENKLQRKILDAFWKEKFGELFDEQKIAQKDQGALF